jgi:type IV secretory pathway VirB4 component
MKKDKEWSGLLKIPSEIIISELRLTIGQQISYIQELEDKLKDKEIKNVKLTKLEHLEKDKERLTKIIRDYENKVYKLNNKIKILEKELLNFLKEKQKIS